MCSSRSSKRSNPELASSANCFRNPTKARSSRRRSNPNLLVAPVMQDKRFLVIPISCIRSGRTLKQAPKCGLRSQFTDDKNRSEEHTSELQSLMRISYAVFCLKKKKNTKHTK